MRALLLPNLLLVLIDLNYGFLFTSQEQIKKFVDKSESDLQEIAQKSMQATWNFDTNVTDATFNAKLNEQGYADRIFARIGKRARRYDQDKVDDPIVRRKLEFLSNIGSAVLRPDILRNFHSLLAKMGRIYSSAKVDSYNSGSRELSLNPDIVKIMAQSEDPAELEYYWTQWRDVTGKNMLEMFKEYSVVYNLAANMSGLQDASDLKLIRYESPSFKQEIEELWSGLQPLYKELHSYVRSKLSGKYGESVINHTSGIPAHLLGNMWGHSWTNLGSMLTPYPSKPSINVTSEMKRQSWTARTMFEKADDFFQSMGLKPVPRKFWENSMMEKPEGREVVCHPSAYDFYTKDDVRIKQCTEVTQEDFLSVSHEMGHVQYYLQYQDQPYLFRDGANPGFHEAVADIASLAMGSGQYFKRIGLLPEEVDIEDKETNINFLFGMALQKLSSLPYSYLVDRFRWDVFENKTSLSNMNCHWWKLRQDIEGIVPPNKRSYSQFDAGSKFHIANDVGYIRYFTAFIYEFQIFQSLCTAAGEYVPGNPKKPLHRCNIYSSLDAGDKFKQMLQIGASKPWQEVLEVVTGSTKMSVQPLIEYFRPLQRWLTKENRNNKAKIGWDNIDMNDICSPAPSSAKGVSESIWLMIIIVLFSFTI